MTDQKSRNDEKLEELQTAAAFDAVHLEGLEVESLTQWQLARRKFFQHKLAMTSLVILLLVFGAALFADFIAPYDFAEVDVPNRSLAPTFVDQHYFGTDKIGRDYFSRTLFGTRTSVYVAFIVAGLSTAIGVVIGGIAGYYGGKIDNLLMRMTDLFLTVPFLAILLVLSAFLGAGSPVRVALILGFLFWTGLARIVRGEFLSLREKEFVEAAKVLGASDSRIIFRHILPNTMGPIIVNATLTVASAILIEAALSFLGFGVQPPFPALGVLIADGQDSLTTLWWLATFPGLMIVLIALCINFVGDGLRRPRSKAKSQVTEPVLSIRDLVVEFDTPDGVVHAVDGVSYDVYPGETLGVVGESGSGKSVTVMASLGLIQMPPGRIVRGEVLYKGRNIIGLPIDELRKIRNKEIAMIFQDPMTSLNPVFKVGHQIAEALLVHDDDMSEDTAQKETIDLLELVGVPDPARRYDQYPHEYSGGMRQRAMIAMAMANKPSVLIADEPTTALDVTIQAQVLEVMRIAAQETGAATVLITHDLGVVAEMADRVTVMYGGRVVERGSVDEIFHAPRHPYTLGLMMSLPRVTGEIEKLLPIPGNPPSVINLPPGCAFHPRCRMSEGRELCRTRVPEVVQVTGGHESACHFPEEVVLEIQRESSVTGIEL